jgi:hypothetical protein
MNSPRTVTDSDQRHAAVTASRRHRPTAAANPAGRRMAILSLTALGVVYGDIGTSPLYAFRACFHPQYGLPRDAHSVLGVLSLIVWSLILIVSVKYILVILRLDNRGEGGIMALLALVGKSGGMARPSRSACSGPPYGDESSRPRSGAERGRGDRDRRAQRSGLRLPVTLLVLFLLFFC